MVKVGDRRLPFGLQWVGGSDWVILHKYYKISLSCSMSIPHIGSGQDLDECTDGNYKVSEC